MIRVVSVDHAVSCNSCRRLPRDAPGPNSSSTQLDAPSLCAPDYRVDYTSCQDDPIRGRANMTIPQVEFPMPMFWEDS